MTLTMQSLMVATPKTTKTSCDTGSNAAPHPRFNPQKYSRTFSCCPVSSWTIRTVCCPLRFFAHLPEGLYQGASSSTTSSVLTHGIAFFLSRPAPAHTNACVGWPSFSGERIVTCCHGPVLIKSRSLSTWQIQYCCCKCTVVT